MVVWKVLGEVTAIIIDLVFLLLNLCAFQIRSISYKHITHRLISVGSRHLAKTHQEEQNRTTGNRHYNPPINFRARSLDKTHHMIQNQTTGIRPPSNIFRARDWSKDVIPQFSNFAIYVRTFNFYLQ